MLFPSPVDILNESLAKSINISKQTGHNFEILKNLKLQI